jgi:putative restriction endonuclease
MLRARGSRVLRHDDAGMRMQSPQDRSAVWLERVGRIRQWQQRGERAPHKPLLLLYALGRLHRELPDDISYHDAAPELATLLSEFGPPRSTSPAYPFRRLANDEALWEVNTATGADPGDTAGRLRELAAVGRLTPAFSAALRAEPELLVAIARLLLEENWPASLHSEIAGSVGLDLDSIEASLIRERLERDGASPRQRDPGFRARVLVAYEYRCAFCGYDGRLLTSAVGLDAAHVRWWSHDGPDSVDNGVCLCTLHHRLLDLGVLGITRDHAVAVSKQFVGHSGPARDLVIELAGRPVHEPQRGEPSPAEAHVEWHSSQVFRGPARVA